jgi:hypothetical protein
MTCRRNSRGVIAQQFRRRLRDQVPAKAASRLDAFAPSQHR